MLVPDSWDEKFPRNKDSQPRAHLRPRLKEMTRYCRIRYLERDDSKGYSFHFLEHSLNLLKKGGIVAKKARIDLEQETGNKVITGENYLPQNKVKKLSNKDKSEDNK